MATRRTSLGIRLEADNRDFKAKLEESRRLGRSTMRDLSGMGGGSGGGGILARGWTELHSKIQVVTSGLRTVGNVAANLFKSEASMENLIRGLASASDGSMTLRQELEGLRETAKLPGLGFREAIEGATALKQTGLNAEEARRALEAFGNALANAGRGKDDLSAVILSLQQMKSTKLVDMQNLKELARRIPGFLEIAGAVDKSDVDTWIRGVVTELEKLPKAAESAQDALDNLKDTVDQKRLGLTGGKVAAVGGTVLSELGKLLGGQTDIGSAIDEIQQSAGEGDLISKYEPNKAELERRAQRRQEAIKAAQERARKAFKEGDEELGIIGETEREKIKEVLEAEIALEQKATEENRRKLNVLQDELTVMRQAADLAKKMGTDTATVTTHLEKHLRDQRKLEDLRRTAGEQQSPKDMAEQLAIDQARGRGHGRRADKLEKARDLRTRTAEIMEKTGKPEEVAAAFAKKEQDAKADAERIAAGGRRKMRGATNTRKGATGLDEDPTFSTSNNIMTRAQERGEFGRLDAKDKDKRDRKSIFDKPAPKDPTAEHLTVWRQIEKNLRDLLEVTRNNSPSTGEKTKPRGKRD